MFARRRFAKDPNVFPPTPLSQVARGTPTVAPLPGGHLEALYRLEYSGGPRRRHTLLGFQAQYRGGERWEVSVGGTNLLDENYELAWGYPEQGRSEYVRMRLNF